MRNTIIIAVAVAFSGLFSTINAQDLAIIPSNIQYTYEEMNAKAAMTEEGISIGDENSFALSENEVNVMPTATLTGAPTRTDTVNFTMKKTETALVPLISNDEIAAINEATAAYQWARTYRLASSKTPRYDLGALRSIYGDEKTVSEIAYRKMTPEQRAQEEAAVNLAAEKQRNYSVANGY